MEIPPPLTPPHMGEGDFAPTPNRANFPDISWESGAGVSLPLAGRGQGWG
jgi:hypothetical protein